VALWFSRRLRGAVARWCPILGREVHYHVRVSYITRRPSSRLSGVVERLWRVDAPPTGTAETICPDGCSEIVIHLGDPMRDQPRNLLVGPMDVPITVTPIGRMTMLGARLTPDGLHRLLPISQQRLLQRVVALDDVWSAWTRRTLDQVASVAAASQQLNVFEAALELLLPESFADRRGDGVGLMLRAMRARGGPIDVERVAGIAGVSRRQLERRFRERVGLPPHLFGRIVRLRPSARNPVRRWPHALDSSIRRIWFTRSVASPAAHQRCWPMPRA
jgi:AraC-like DNA-binding protein